MKPMLMLLSCFMVALFATCTPLVAAQESKDVSAVRQVIEAQQAAWNRHDLEGFMAGYWNSPELTFFSGVTMTSGWQATHDRYVKRYQSGGHAMGTLEFRNLNIQMLGKQGAFVRGEYHLTMPDGSTPHGIFTLVFRKFPGSAAAGGWKVIHDHTSVATE